jgi:hypothetical protein
VNVNKKLLAALSGAAAVLLLVTGCGDDTGKKRDAWAKGVCDQAAAQLKKIDDANNSLSGVDSGGQPADVKKADSTAFQTISDAYAQVAAIFNKAGAAPGGDKGATFQQNAVHVFNSLSTQYAGLKKQVDGLDTSSQASFATGLQKVSTSLGKTTASVQSSLASVRQGDTGAALAKQPGCQQVSSGTVTATPSGS